IDASEATNFEKARLLWKLLERANIKAEFAYCARFLIGHLDMKSPVPNFDHQLLWVPTQPGLAAGIFVDPSCDFCRTGEVPEWDQGVEAMIVHAIKRPLENLPRVNMEQKKIEGQIPLPRQFHTTAHVRIGETGDAEVTLAIAAQGLDAQNERERT